MTGKTTTNRGAVIQKDSPRKKLLCVSEGLHVLNQQVYDALTKRNGDALLTLARKHLHSNANALAVNLGTGRKMADLTPWVVNVLTDQLNVPLFLSANILCHPELLHRFGDKIIINAVTADPDILAHAMETANRFRSELVVLLVKPGLTPSGVDDRLLLAAEVLDQADKTGLDPHRLFLDPVLSLRPDPHALKVSRGIPDAGVVAESIGFIKELNSSVKTIVGLGTGTQALNMDRRGRIQKSILSLLFEAGLDAVIMNCRTRTSSKKKAITDPKVSLAA